MEKNIKTNLKSKMQIKAGVLFKKLSNLRHRLRIFKVITSILIVIIFVGFWYAAKWYYSIGEPLSSIEAIAPYSKEIKKIIKPLRYSGLPDLMRPEVSISLDFKNKLWHLHNIHRFDKKGNVILIDNRFGLCGDLAAYTYDKVTSLLGKHYVVEIVRVMESGYFLTPQASHMVLSIRACDSKDEYILDPSFRRHGHIKNFEDYLFFDRMEVLPFVVKKHLDETFPVGGATPILIKRGFLLGLTVEGQNGKFDKNNFVISIGANRRHRYAGRYVFAIRKNEGQTEILEDKSLISALLRPGEYTQLRERIIELFSRL